MTTEGWGECYLLACFVVLRYIAFALLRLFSFYFIFCATRHRHGDTGWKYVPKIVQALQGQMVVQVTCGSYHTAAVSENGELYTWGGGMVSFAE